MGSVIEYRCGQCQYTTGPLRVGWGKAGRGAFWGAVGFCPACKELISVDLSDPRVERRSDRRCSRCNGPVKVVEGTEMARCPQCGAPLKRAPQGTWD